MYCSYMAKLLQQPVEQDYLLCFCNVPLKVQLEKRHLTPIYAQILACYNVTIMLVPIGHSIFLPTKEV